MINTNTVQNYDSLCNTKTSFEKGCFLLGAASENINKKLNQGSYRRGFPFYSSFFEMFRDTSIQNIFSKSTEKISWLKANGEDVKIEEKILKECAKFLVPNDFDKTLLHNYKFCFSRGISLAEELRNLFMQEEQNVSDSHQ